MGRVSSVKKEIDPVSEEMERKQHKKPGMTFSKKLSYLIQYLIIRVVACVIYWLPGRLAFAAGSFVTGLVHRFDHRHRHRVHKHMTRVFGEGRSREEIAGMVQDFYRHLGWMAVEFIRQIQIKRDDVDSLFDLSEAQTFQEVFGRGKGVICTTGHAGCWELSGHLSGLMGLPVYAVARPLDNPYLDRFVKRIRETGGQKILSRKNVLSELRKVLSEGGMVGIIQDQHARKNAVWSPFLGLPAATSRSIANLHLRTGAPIVVASVNRIRPGKEYRAHVWKVIEHPPSDNYSRDVEAVTRSVNEGLEQAIHRYPEQWLWTHRRWREPPSDGGPDPV